MSHWRGTGRNGQVFRGCQRPGAHETTSQGPAWLEFKVAVTPPFINPQQRQAGSNIILWENHQ